jgi:hypothetical protein
LIVTFGLAVTAIKAADELKDLAPVFGLFGTIVGYLLGSAHGRQSSQSERSPSTDAPVSDASASGTPPPPHSN